MMVSLHAEFYILFIHIRTISTDGYNSQKINKTYLCRYPLSNFKAR